VVTIIYRSRMTNCAGGDIVYLSAHRNIISLCICMYIYISLYACIVFPLGMWHYMTAKCLLLSGVYRLWLLRFTLNVMRTHSCFQGQWSSVFFWRFCCVSPWINLKTCTIHFVEDQEKLHMVFYISPVTIAVRSEAWVLAGWLLESWVRIPLKAWMFVRVFLCCVVLCA
jgi:hypothetical protein